MSLLHNLTLLYWKSHWKIVTKLFCDQKESGVKNFQITENHALIVSPVLSYISQRWQFRGSRYDFVMYLNENNCVSFKQT